MKNEVVSSEQPYKGNEDCLDGWCRVEGPLVYSDFFMNDAAKPRRVTKVKAWGGTRDGKISTDGGNGGQPLVDVDFRQWIKRYPPPPTK